MQSSTIPQNPSTKTTTLKFVATSVMSPSAKIVVYFLRDDGELIADSVTIKVNGAFENDVSSKVLPWGRVRNVNDFLTRRVFTFVE